jgi:hypothetical protein
MFTCCNSNVQLACAKMTRTWGWLISSNPRIPCFYEHSNNQLIKPYWCSLVCRCRWGNKMFYANCLDVSNVDQWFIEKVRSNPSTMYFLLQSFGGGRKWDVLHANTIWRGKKSPLIVDDTTIVICLLSSIPRILTCFLPLISQKFSPIVGTRWILVLSLLLPMKRECCKLHWVWNLMTRVTFLFTSICWNFSCYTYCFPKQPIHVMFNKLTRPFPYNQKVTKTFVKNFKSNPLDHPSKDWLANAC